MKQIRRSAVDRTRFNPRATNAEPGTAPVAVDLRGEKTRTRLLEAGLRLFGRHGPDGVTTRELASEAGVNLAAIPYHFRSKEGVYVAVAQTIVQRLGSELVRLAEQINANLLQPQRRPRSELISLLLELMTSMLRTISLSQERVLVGMFVIREQMQPSEAFNVLYEGFMRPVGTAYANAIAALRGLSPDDTRVGIEVQMLVGQVLMFCIGRETLLRRLRWKQLDENHIREIERVMEAVVRQQFAGPRSHPRDAAGEGQER
jgi:TetR/AcrR family transcriptional regulator, regulator of cefoperazone and chloramphenicol sensitivity